MRRRRENYSKSRAKKLKNFLSPTMATLFDSRVLFLHLFTMHRDTWKKLFSLG